MYFCHHHNSNDNVVILKFTNSNSVTFSVLFLLKQDFYISMKPDCCFLVSAAKTIPCVN